MAQVMSKKYTQMPPLLVIPDATILEYINYLLLNISSVEDTGLALGKAGICLALFEVADLLKLEDLKKKATRLLEECLLLSSPNLSFKTGWAGIIYAVRYLQHRHLIEIEFEEIFHEYEVALVARMTGLIQQNEREVLLEAVSLGIPFADGHNPEGEKLLKIVLEKCFIYYNQLWKEIVEGNSQTYLKVSLLQKEFYHLIYMSCICKVSVPASHFAFYMKACQQSYIAMSTLERCRFNFLRQKQQEDEDIRMIELLPQLTNLRNLISLWVHYENKPKQLISVIEPLLTTNLKKREEAFSLLTTDSPRISFENGVARLLLLLCSERQPINTKTVIRSLLV